MTRVECGLLWALLPVAIFFGLVVWEFDNEIQILQDQIAGLSLENARLRSEIIYYSHDHRILEGLRERVDEHEGTLRQMGTLQTRVFDLEQKVFPEKYRWAPSDYNDYGD